jgi:hypothetical protein
MRTKKSTEEAGAQRARGKRLHPMPSLRQKIFGSTSTPASPGLPDGVSASYQRQSGNKQ